jgi:hypothetical protein
VQVREPPLVPLLAPLPPLRPPAAPLVSPWPRVSVSRPFAARTALGASSLVPLVLLVPLVPLVPRVPRVPRVPVSVLGRRVSRHAAPLLRQIAFAPFFAVLAPRGSWR